MLVDHLFQYRISRWPKTAEKRGICTGVTDGPTDGQNDGGMDGPTDGQTLLQRCVLSDTSKNGHSLEISPSMQIAKNQILPPNIGKRRCWCAPAQRFFP